MPKEKIINIPNLLSFYRIIVFPLILFFIVNEQELLFAVFLIINLITDVLDGWIARRFDLQTEFGARLDSMADNLTYLLAILGILNFKLEEFSPHLNSFFLYVGLIATTLLISLIKFKRFPSLHLYSWKIGGYIQGFFIAVLFGYGFITLFYYFMIIWGILSAIEHIIVQLYISKLKSNAKGLYWIIKNKNKKNFIKE